MATHKDWERMLKDVDDDLEAMGERPLNLGENDAYDLRHAHHLEQRERYLAALGRSS